MTLCGVSRTPIREALRRLQSEGIVDIAPNSGATVAAWSKQEFADLYDVRTRLEGMAAGLAAERRTEHDLNALAASVETMAMLAERYDAAPDHVAIAFANSAFHGGILEAARSRALSLAARQVMDAPLMLRTFRQYSQEKLRNSVSQHQEIIEAISIGDADWARVAMTSHIKRGFRALVSRPVVVPAQWDQSKTKTQKRGGIP